MLWSSALEPFYNWYIYISGEIKSCVTQWCSGPWTNFVILGHQATNFLDFGLDFFSAFVHVPQNNMYTTEYLNIILFCSSEGCMCQPKNKWLEPCWVTTIRIRSNNPHFSNFWPEHVVKLLSMQLCLMTQKKSTWNMSLVKLPWIQQSLGQRGYYLGGIWELFESSL